MYKRQLEDLGFCAKGEGGRFVADGNLISGVGRLPFNTDAVSYTHLRAHETVLDLVCRLLLET